MAWNSSQGRPPLTRRRWLQGALRGAVGVLAWQHGCFPLRTALAQKGAPSGQMTRAIHVTIAPTWFDPAETPGIITPFMFLYALHDVFMKPMPDSLMSPSLAARWSESADGLSYDFELRRGVKFHNRDAFTAADAKFSFERYRGSGATDLKRKVKSVDIVNPHQVRFHLHEPWPDFLTFYATPATGAAWIVPKTYVEKVGDEGFKAHPIGLGPYRFVSYQPGVEAVYEAYVVVLSRRTKSARSRTWRFRAGGPLARRQRVLRLLCTVRGRLRGLKSQRWMYGVNNRQPSTTAPGGKPSYRRYSRNCMMNPGFCRFGRWVSCAPLDRVSPSLG